MNEQKEYARLRDPNYVDLLAAIGSVYDVGLLAVPRGILLKPDKLDAEEQAVVQTHTTVGFEVFQGAMKELGGATPWFTLAAQITRSHHERWDGEGYPDQLSGEDIPLAARVISIVSAYEALRTRRAFRPAQTHLKALKIIAHDSPGQFDPVLLAAFQAAATRFEQIHQKV